MSMWQVTLHTCCAPNHAFYDRISLAPAMNCVVLVWDWILCNQLVVVEDKIFSRNWCLLGTLRVCYHVSDLPASHWSMCPCPSFSLAIAIRCWICVVWHLGVIYIGVPGSRNVQIYPDTDTGWSQDTAHYTRVPWHNVHCLVLTPCSHVLSLITNHHPRGWTRSSSWWPTLCAGTHV